MDLQPLAVARVVIAALVFTQAFNNIALFAGAILIVAVGGSLGALANE